MTRATFNVKVWGPAVFAFKEAPCFNGVLVFPDLVTADSVARHLSRVDVLDLCEVYADIPVTEYDFGDCVEHVKVCAYRDGHLFDGGAAHV